MPEIDSCTEEAISIKSRIGLIAIVAALFASGIAIAHHSRANFELDRIVTIEDKVTEWSWRSPHVWMKVESPGENGEAVEWLVEGNAIPGLRRRGWSKESFAAGDEVVASGNPDRNPDNQFMFLSA